MTEQEVAAAGTELIHAIYECGAEIEARHGPMPPALVLAAVRSATAVTIAKCVRGDAGAAARELDEFCERLRVRVAQLVEGDAGRAIHH